MVQCSRKRKTCFYWSTAVIIASEICIFFFLLLYYNLESHASLQDPSGSSAGVAEKTGKLSVTSGFLNILPSVSKHLLVDFSNYSMYMLNMNAIILDYANYRTRNCRRAPKLDLGDCTGQSLYGIQDGAFCLIARLDETKDWLPDEFLRTDWLPNYNNRSLSISCDVIAQNASVYRNGKVHQFYYKKQLRNIFPASGFSKEYFPLLDEPSNCYPPVTIKVDDPFVLDNDHDYTEITCTVWTNNWRKLVASSASINVTILHRGQRWQVARKPYISPELPFERTDHALKPKSTMKPTVPNITRMSSATSERTTVYPIPVTENTGTTNVSTKPLFTQSSLSATDTPSLTTVKSILTDGETLPATISKTTSVTLLINKTLLVSSSETTPTTLPTDETSPFTAVTSPTVSTEQVTILEYYEDNSGSSDDFAAETSITEQETTTTLVNYSNLSQGSPAETYSGFPMKKSEEQDKALVSVSSKEVSSTMFPYSISSNFKEPSFSAVSTATSEQNTSTLLDAEETASRSYPRDYEVSPGRTNTDRIEEYVDEEDVTSTAISFVEGIEAGAESNSYD